jgi:hypothetical protein
MNKSDYLELIKLLSALESWGFATKELIPDYVSDKLQWAIDKLSKEVLNDRVVVAPKENEPEF